MCLTIRAVIKMSGSEAKKKKKQRKKNPLQKLCRFGGNPPQRFLWVIEPLWTFNGPTCVSATMPPALFGNLEYP